MKLKDIHLGNIDAKNELLSNSPQERERFLSSFVVPPGLDIESYYSRGKYFVLGLKGTGKTALLRYVSISCEEQSSARTSFVLFKSDIDEDSRKSFSSAARSSIVDNNSSEFSGDDFEHVWRWFIYRKIVAECEEGAINLFQNNSRYSDFARIVNSPSSGRLSKRVFDLIPKLKRGNVEISSDPKVGLEFSWDERGVAKINFNDLVKKADEAFDSLSAGDEALNVFFDELELGYNTKRQYQRDSKLIRDLVVSIEKLNAVSKRNGFNLCIYSAIRSEVQTSVDSLGKEINKSLSDFGSEIIWNRAGLDSSSQPLLNIVSQRLMAGDVGNAESQDLNDVWDRYFTKTVQGHDVREYILHRSWYRPRDIVRMLKTAQEQYPEESSFKHHVFDAIRKKYSESSWVEVSEELKAKYKDVEISGVKRLLYGYKQIFTLAELMSRAQDIRELYPEVGSLVDSHSIPKVLGDLYRIGIIGNIENKIMRFSFRGDDEILLDQKCFVHNALKPYLSIR